jgi:peptidoglycan/LPS O-acetylase OafA/YrhL
MLMAASKARLYYGTSIGDESARIQTLRGLACLLVVGFHVVGFDAAVGMRVASDSAWRLATNVLLHIRMPLFTFLSGFVYAYRPVVAGQELAFARKKAIRLLVPLGVVSTVFFFMQMVVPNVNSPASIGNLWKIYVFPYEHFWFLQAILLTFLLVIAVERWRLLDTGGRYALGLLVAVAINLLVVISPDIFSSNEVCFLLPFFVAGIGANRFRATFLKGPVRLCVGVVFLVTMSVFLYRLLGSGGHPTARGTVLTTALSLSSVVTLLYVFPGSTLLARIGQFSFTIYLYHVFFTAGSRIMLEHAGFGAQQLLLFAVGLVAGVLGPVAVELLLRPSVLGRRWLLGQA